MKIAVIGTGVYSAALVYHLQQKSENQIYLWTENAKLVQKFSKRRKFDFLSKEIVYKENVFLSANMEDVMKDASAVFIVVGSKYFKQTLCAIKPYYKSQVPIFVGTKGMDFQKNIFFSDITRTFLKCHSYYYFAGPTFAKDIIKDSSFSLTVAGSNRLGVSVFSSLWHDGITLEYIRDLNGLEILSVLKNVYAIGCGILKGLHVSKSRYYVFLTNVLREVMDILKTCDGDITTLSCYGGIGDLLLTCNSETSRNFTLGNMIGEKKDASSIADYVQKTTVEGYENLKEMASFLSHLKLKHTILERIYSVVIEKSQPECLFEEQKKQN